MNSREASRELITKVLRAEVTPESDPILFEDEVLDLEVPRLERHDAPWLLERIADPLLPFEGRLQICARLLGPAREQAEAILRRERPNLIG